MSERVEVLWAGDRERRRVGAGGADRRPGACCGLYCAVAIGLPALSSKDLLGLGRYAMAAFPLFLALAFEFGAYVS